MLEKYFEVNRIVDMDEVKLEVKRTNRTVRKARKGRS